MPTVIASASTLLLAGLVAASDSWPTGSAAWASPVSSPHAGTPVSAISNDRPSTYSSTHVSSWSKTHTKSVDAASTSDVESAWASESGVWTDRRRDYTSDVWDTVTVGTTLTAFTTVIDAAPTASHTWATTPTTASWHSTTVHTAHSSPVSAYSSTRPSTPVGPETTSRSTVSTWSSVRASSYSSPAAPTTLSTSWTAAATAPWGASTVVGRAAPADAAPASAAAPSAGSSDAAPADQLEYFVADCTKTWDDTGRPDGFSFDLYSTSDAVALAHCHADDISGGQLTACLGLDFLWAFDAALDVLTVHHGDEVAMAVIDFPHCEEGAGAPGQCEDAADNTYPLVWEASD